MHEICEMFSLSISALKELIQKLLGIKNKYALIWNQIPFQLTHPYFAISRNSLWYNPFLLQVGFLCHCSIHQESTTECQYQMKIVHAHFQVKNAVKVEVKIAKKRGKKHSFASAQIRTISNICELNSLYGTPSLRCLVESGGLELGSQQCKRNEKPPVRDVHIQPYVPLLFPDCGPIQKIKWGFLTRSAPRHLHLHCDVCQHTRDSGRALLFQLALALFSQSLSPAYPSPLLSPVQKVLLPVGSDGHSRKGHQEPCRRGTCRQGVEDSLL